jgi:hypothetical protein
LEARVEEKREVYKLKITEKGCAVADHIAVAVRRFRGWICSEENKISKLFYTG